MNKVLLVGNVGGEFQLRYTQSGQAVMNLRLATNEGHKDASGQWVEHTEWHDVVIWGNQAEGLAKFLHSGMCIAVEGKIRTESWEDQQQPGTKKFRTRIQADRVDVHEKKGQAAGPPPQQRQQQRPPQQPPPAQGWTPPPQNQRPQQGPPAGQQQQSSWPGQQQGAPPGWGLNPSGPDDAPMENPYTGAPPQNPFGGYPSGGGSRG